MVLNEDLIKDLIKSDNWKYKKKSIIRNFKFNSYMDGIKFVNEIAELAENKNHHPDIQIGWCNVELSITSHDLGGVTNQCVEFANEIELI
ncbi:MAG: 4a-hydroxytetrahydrobiopterin dehydratase [Candidatus Marinimicrobia bacterium]|nr:4a-hydroxytetrahydrobiopterin dehydratase [Candidatus Neomarinimicrobiota bacterium]